MPFKKCVLTVNKRGAGSGHVRSLAGGIDCGNTCSADYSVGSWVDLHAWADAGSHFAGWSGDGHGIVGTRSVFMDGDKAVDATFDAGPSSLLAVTKTGTGAGTVRSTLGGISCGSTCTASYHPMDIIVLEAIPDASSHFAGWSGDGATLGNTRVVSMETNRDVKARFDAGAWTLPDLVVERLVFSTKDRTVRYRVKNIGATRSRSATVRVQTIQSIHFRVVPQDPERSITLSREFPPDEEIPALLPGTSHEFTHFYSVASSAGVIPFPIGTLSWQEMEVLVIADVRERVTESSESNNAARAVGTLNAAGIYE